MEEPRHYRILLLGNAGAGKTTYLTLLQTGKFDRRYRPTTGYKIQYLTFQKDDDGTKFVYDVYDTAGQEFFNGAYDTEYFTNVDGVIIMVGIVSSITLNKLPKWIKVAQTLCPTDNIVICGTESGIYNSPAYVQLHKFADYYPVFTISSTSQKNITPFMALSRYIVHTPHISLITDPSPPARIDLSELAKKIMAKKQAIQAKQEEEEKIKKQKIIEFITPIIQGHEDDILQNLTNEFSFGIKMTQESSNDYRSLCDALKIPQTVRLSYEGLDIEISFDKLYTIYIHA